MMQLSFDRAVKTHVINIHPTIVYSKEPYDIAKGIVSGYITINNIQHIILMLM